jgi:Flp pilus assembly protein TadG
MLSLFGRDARGNVAIMFALATLPLVAFSGAALDYSRASNVKTELQSAVDATVLALSREPTTEASDAFNTKARAFFDMNFKPGVPSTVTTFSPNRVQNKFHLYVKVSVKTTLLNTVGFTSLDIATQGDAMFGSKNLEVVMALDNTGSMNDSGKIAALRTAATNLVNTVSAAATSYNTVKIGMVPFATRVKVDPATYKTASWIDFTGTTTNCTQSFNWSTWSYVTTCSPINKNTWTGCIQDRASPLDVSDDAVTAATSTMYPATPTCNSQEGGLSTVVPLTDNYAGLKTAISGMTAGGNTNVTIGVAWAMALLSKQAPFTEGAPASDLNTAKFMIVLTDGDNTQNAVTSNQSSIDARTTLACTNAKAMATVYTIRVIDGNASLLRNCATDPSKYYEVSSASQLDPVFQAIAAQITSLRLTN